MRARCCMVCRAALVGAAVLLLSAVLCAQIFGGKKNEETEGPRNLSGAVLDKAKHAVPNAVVYLENTRTLSVITYISGEDGSYRFNNLSSKADYTVHAESDGRRSKVRTLSAFDSRKYPRINLRLGN